MKVLIAGDYCPCYRLLDSINRGDYQLVLGDAKKWTSKADYSIVNLECPVSYLNNKKINKRGPHLSCDSKSVEALKWAGFNCVTLANNHFFDYGEDGVANTIKTCNHYSLDYVGGGLTLKEAAQILYKTVNHEKIAIINCCEHEFSIAMEMNGGSNPLNPISQYYSIQEAKKNSHFVIVIVHGGHEHYQLPSTRMQQTYRFFIDAGADAVINHHQHCYSGYEYYNGKPIFYGLGNFCFDEKPVLIGQPYNYGYAVLLSIENEIVDFELFPYEQCGEKVGVFELPADSFKKQLEEINTIIADDRKLSYEEQHFYESTFPTVGAVLNSNKNRLIRSLNRMLFPSKQFGADYILKLYNLILCESHRDRVLRFLISKYKELDTYEH